MEPFGAYFGGNKGISVSLHQHSIHLHCGGTAIVDTESYGFLSETTRNCYSFVSEDTHVSMVRENPIPFYVSKACVGGDGDRVVAVDPWNDVAVLEEVAGSWERVRVGLMEPRARAAGVLMGDYLLCLGGYDVVGGGWGRGILKGDGDGGGEGRRIVMEMGKVRILKLGTTSTLKI